MGLCSKLVSWELGWGEGQDNLGISEPNAGPLVIWLFGAKKVFLTKTATQMGVGGQRKRGGRSGKVTRTQTLCGSF